MIKGGGADLISETNFRKILIGHVCFKRYFTLHEFQSENFKSQITLSSCKIHASNYNFKSYQASPLNPLPPSEERLSSKSFSLISACSQNTHETKNTRKFQGKRRYFRSLRIFRIDRRLTFPFTLYKMHAAQCYRHRTAYSLKARILNLGCLWIM